MESYLSTLNPQDRYSLLSLIEPKDNISEVSAGSSCDVAMDLHEENKRLKRQLAYYKQQWNEIKTQKERIEASLESLRGLVSLYMGSETKLVQKSNTEKQFWRKVQIDNLLDKSDPPPDYPFPEAELPSTRAQVQKLAADLSSTLKELNSLKAKHEKLENNYSCLSVTHTQYKHEAEKLHEADQKKLKAIVRRVQYLVGEKTRVEEEVKRQSAYVTKLELRLVQDETRLKEIKNYKKPLSARLMEPLQVDYKFE